MALNFKATRERGEEKTERVLSNTKNKLCLQFHLSFLRTLTKVIVFIYNRTFQREQEVLYIIAAKYLTAPEILSDVNSSSSSFHICVNYSVGLMKSLSFQPEHKY
jgi:negative regulator of genetic competence, sporulation and motility